MSDTRERRPTTKKCARCGLVKPLESFYRYSKGKLGRTSRCKACQGAGATVRDKEARWSKPRLFDSQLGLHELSPEWHLDALCRRIEGDWVYVPLGGVRANSEVKELELSVCRVCPVRAECLDHAMIRNEPYGIWGGKLPSQRRRMRLEQQ